MQSVFKYALWVLLLTVGIAQYSSAQQKILEKKFTFDFTRSDLKSALQTIADQADLNISYPGKEMPGKDIGARFNDVSLYHIFQTLLSEQNFSYYYIGQNSYVVRKEEVGYDLSYQVSGFVWDKKSGKPIPGCVVVCPDENAAVRTNDSGFFALRLKNSPQELLFTSESYLTRIMFVNRSGKYYMSVALESNRLKEVLKRSGSNDTSSIDFGSDGVSLNFDALEESPTVQTSTGALNSVKFIPGFQSTLDVNGGISVRGGGLDENLVLFDGIPVYNPMHLPGWFSVYSKSSMDKAELVKSGFSPKYGNRTSSVINAQTKKGNSREFKGEATISPISGEAMIQGPIVRNKVSFIVSGRRTITDYLAGLIKDQLRQNGLDAINFYLYDLHAGVDWKTGTNSALKFRFYRGGDKGYLNSRFRTDVPLSIREDNQQSYLWGNNLGSIEWLQFVQKKAVIHASAYYSRYGFKLNNTYSINIRDDSTQFDKVNELKYENSILDLGGRVDVNWQIKPKHALRTGYHIVSHRFQPPSTTYSTTINGKIIDESVSSAQDFKMMEHNAYVAYEYSGPKFNSSLGLRANHFHSDSNYFSLQPRVSLAWYPRKGTKLFVHGDRMVQNIFAVTNTETGLPYSVWVPVSKGLSPIVADQLNIGISRRFKAYGQLIIEAYDKEYRNVINYRNTAVDLLRDWQSQLSSGTGFARGVEVTYKSRWKNLSGWLSYTLSNAQRKYPDINNGQYFPYQFNRKHDFTVFLNYKLSDRWTFGGSWIFASGNYVTIPESRHIVHLEDQILLVETFGHRNNYQLPNYHRLDLGATHTIEKPNYTHKLSLSIYNAYFNQNPYYVTLGFNEAGKPVLNQVSLLPFFPLIQYAISFH